MSTQQCKSTYVGLLRDLESPDAESQRWEVLHFLHGNTDILDVMFIKNSSIYVCKTQTTTVPEVQPRGLSLHINPGTNYVKRWRPESILLYFISHENLPSGPATLECIREGMVLATNEWHRVDINITFQETHSHKKATFTVIYDTAPSSHDFAEAFFPGDGERIVRLGPLAFEPAHIKYISNILSHELGHVLALRHDSWEDAGEGNKASRGGKGEPAWYFPSKDLNHSSIMNHRNAVDLSLLVVGDRDRDEASRFYKLAAGKYGDVEVVDVDP
ncbi:hypothetical protein HBH52_176780 [Parastagonospora nodorum]|nr:hypothetical protein HBH52_176780 [Parastagonospora nodorum]